MVASLARKPGKRTARVNARAAALAYRDADARRRDEVRRAPEHLKKYIGTTVGLVQPANSEAGMYGYDGAGTPYPGAVVWGTLCAANHIERRLGAAVVVEVREYSTDSVVTRRLVTSKTDKATLTELRVMAAIAMIKGFAGRRVPVLILSKE